MKLVAPVVSSLADEGELGPLADAEFSPPVDTEFDSPVDAELRSAVNEEVGPPVDVEASPPVDAEPIPFVDSAELSSLVENAALGSLVDHAGPDTEVGVAPIMNDELVPTMEGGVLLTTVIVELVVGPAVCAIGVGELVAKLLMPGELVELPALADVL